VPLSMLSWTNKFIYYFEVFLNNLLRRGWDAVFCRSSRTDIRSGQKGSLGETCFDWFGNKDFLYLNII
jgi:hypothetical protein